MTVRVTRSFEFEVPGERVWEFIADPAKRAAAVSVVERFELGEGGDATWHVRLPVPVVDATIAVETEEVERDPPHHVKFVGTSRAMRVVGEHTVRETASGCELVNEFVVDGRLPGVESFFRRNLDAELDNLKAALEEDLELPA
jgi:carbon monoxide dehydrogenase subunit G